LVIQLLILVVVVGPFVVHCHSFLRYVVTLHFRCCCSLFIWLFHVLYVPFVVDSFRCCCCSLLSISFIHLLFVVVDSICILLLLLDCFVADWYVRFLHSFCCCSSFWYVTLRCWFRLFIFILTFVDLLTSFYICCSLDTFLVAVTVAFLCLFFRIAVVGCRWFLRSGYVRYRCLRYRCSACVRLLLPLLPFLFSFVPHSIVVTLRFYVVLAFPCRLRCCVPSFRDLLRSLISFPAVVCLPLFPRCSSVAVERICSGVVVVRCYRSTGCCWVAVVTNCWFGLGMRYLIRTEHLFIVSFITYSCVPDCYCCCCIPCRCIIPTYRADCWLRLLTLRFRCCCWCDCLPLLFCVYLFPSTIPSCCCSFAFCSFGVGDYVVISCKFDLLNSRLLTFLLFCCWFVDCGADHSFLLPFALVICCSLFRCSLPALITLLLFLVVFITFCCCCCCWHLFYKCIALYSLLPCYLLRGWVRWFSIHCSPAFLFHCCCTLMLIRWTFCSLLLRPFALFAVVMRSFFQRWWFIPPLFLLHSHTCYCCCPLFYTWALFWLFYVLVGVLLFVFDIPLLRSVDAFVVHWALLRWSVLVLLFCRSVACCSSLRSSLLPLFLLLLPLLRWFLMRYVVLRCIVVLPLLLLLFVTLFCSTLFYIPFGHCSVILLLFVIPVVGCVVAFRCWFICSPFICVCCVTVTFCSRCCCLFVHSRCLLLPLLFIGTMISFVVPFCGVPAICCVLLFVCSLHYFIQLFVVVTHLLRILQLQPCVFTNCIISHSIHWLLHSCSVVVVPLLFGVPLFVVVLLICWWVRSRCCSIAVVVVRSVVVVCCSFRCLCTVEHALLFCCSFAFLIHTGWLELLYPLPLPFYCPLHRCWYRAVFIVLLHLLLLIWWLVCSAPMHSFIHSVVWIHILLFYVILPLLGIIHSAMFIWLRLWSFISCWLLLLPRDVVLVLMLLFVLFSIYVVVVGCSWRFFGVIPIVVHSIRCIPGTFVHYPHCWTTDCSVLHWTINKRSAYIYSVDLLLLLFLRCCYALVHIPLRYTFTVVIPWYCCLLCGCCGDSDRSLLLRWALLILLLVVVRLLFYITFTFINLLHSVPTMIHCPLCYVDCTVVVTFRTFAFVTLLTVAGAVRHARLLVICGIVGVGVGVDCSSAFWVLFLFLCYCYSRHFLHLLCSCCSPRWLHSVRTFVVTRDHRFSFIRWLWLITDYGVTLLLICSCVTGCVTVLDVSSCRCLLFIRAVAPFASLFGVTVVIALLSLLLCTFWTIWFRSLFHWPVDLVTVVVCVVVVVVVTLYHYGIPLMHSRVVTVRSTDYRFVVRYVVFVVRYVVVVVTFVVAVLAFVCCCYMHSALVVRFCCYALLLLFVVPLLLLFSVLRCAVPGCCCSNCCSLFCYVVRCYVVITVVVVRCLLLLLLLLLLLHLRCCCSLFVVTWSLYWIFYDSLMFVCYVVRSVVRYHSFRLRYVIGWCSVVPFTYLFPLLRRYCWLHFIALLYIVLFVTTLLTGIGWLLFGLSTLLYDFVVRCCVLLLCWWHLYVVLHSLHFIVTLLLYCSGTLHCCCSVHLLFYVTVHGIGLNLCLHSRCSAVVLCCYIAVRFCVLRCVPFMRSSRYCWLRSTRTVRCCSIRCCRSPFVGRCRCSSLLLPCECSTWYVDYSYSLFLLVVTCYDDLLLGYHLLILLFRYYYLYLQNHFHLFISLMSFVVRCRYSVRCWWRVSLCCCCAFVILWHDVRCYDLFCSRCSAFIVDCVVVSCSLHLLHSPFVHCCSFVTRFSLICCSFDIWILVLLPYRVLELFYVVTFIVHCDSHLFLRCSILHLFICWCCSLFIVVVVPLFAHLFVVLHCLMHCYIVLLLHLVIFIVFVPMPGRYYWVDCYRFLGGVIYSPVWRYINLFIWLCIAWIVGIHYDTIITNWVPGFYWYDAFVQILFVAFVVVVPGTFLFCIDTCAVLLFFIPAFCCFDAFVTLCCSCSTILHCCCSHCCYSIVTLLFCVRCSFCCSFSGRCSALMLFSCCFPFVGRLFLIHCCCCCWYICSFITWLVFTFVLVMFCSLPFVVHSTCSVVVVVIVRSWAISFVLLFVFIVSSPHSVILYLFLFLPLCLLFIVVDDYWYILLLLFHCVVDFDTFYIYSVLFIFFVDRLFRFIAVMEYGCTQLVCWWNWWITYFFAVGAWCCCCSVRCYVVRLYITIRCCCYIVVPSFNFLTSFVGCTLLFFLSMLLHYCWWHCWSFCCSFCWFIILLFWWYSTILPFWRSLRYLLMLLWPFCSTLTFVIRCLVMLRFVVALHWLLFTVVVYRRLCCVDTVRWHLLWSTYVVTFHLLVYLLVGGCWTVYIPGICSYLLFIVHSILVDVRCCWCHCCWLHLWYRFIVGIWWICYSFICCWLMI